jgi:hypothetical protein
VVSSIYDAYDDDDAGEYIEPWIWFLGGYRRGDARLIGQGNIGHAEYPAESEMQTALYKTVVLRLDDTEGY